ncbi:MAG: hypothetical protein Q7S05_00100 [bacterium]|nr:hypothetical protein [bacterium]
MEGKIQNTHSRHTRYTIHDTSSLARHTPYAIRHTPAGSRGVTVMLVLAFMGIFTILMGTITSYVFQQGKYGRALFAREQAIHVAEAGLEYYRWFLAHNPSILSAGVGLVSPYTYTVNDPEGGVIGDSVVTATANLQCGAVQWIDLTSVGTSNSAPGFPRTLEARYQKPSVAENSYILNSNVWQVSDVVGPYHSNGGIHMDGANNSNVTSKVSTWTCDSTYGCSPSQSKPGIWGNGTGSSLWSFPATDISFAGMAVNFPTLKIYAQTSGIYLTPTAAYVAGVKQGSSYSSVGADDQHGYHIIFRSDGKVDIYRVTQTSGVSSKHIDDQSHWATDYHTIVSQTLLSGSPFTPPSGCSIIYAQAKTWIEGTVNGKITVIAADTTGTINPDIILQNNINYATTDGTTGLTAIAQHSVLYPLIIPDQMSVRGIFVAQSGYYGRNFYYCVYAPNDKRTSLTVNGTIVSNQRPVTMWGYSSASYGCPGGISSDWNGFNLRTTIYDRLLAFSPPPFTPASSADYKLTLWREK